MAAMQLARFALLSALGKKKDVLTDSSPFPVDRPVS
jgi:hypothetical protein